MGNITQESNVDSFDPSKDKQSEGPSAFTTPMTSFRPEIFKTPFLIDSDNLEDMDAMMYLFRGKTALRRWRPDRVAFLYCLFSNQINTAYGKFDGNRRGYKIDDHFLEYGRGELPYHGSTGSNNRVVEAFAVLIPRIIKVVQSPEREKDFNVKQYIVSYVPMHGLNMSGNDCGAYSLKFIECHLLGLDFSLVNDENIKEARHKIAYDLWEAANDEVLQFRCPHLSLQSVLR
ncbi:hypothetical protein F2Q68_00032347 [Brassica cretica]|uniref:Ubiquitin-like protease family profile domain-containing protein n=1 Tax=Brassica cretica TaxID=69181 RepID=A0A8S9GF97_BRACR|nr:hypothetical protein F2Q68_00032347 [Brassica cretica]